MAEESDSRNQNTQGVDALHNQRREIVLGLVAPLGVELERVSVLLEEAFSCVGYRQITISLSRLIEGIGHGLGLSLELPVEPFDQYVTSRQQAGKHIRSTLELGEALALAACAEIRAARHAPDQALSETVFLLKSLKTVDEIDSLRKIYGSAFVLLAVGASRERRVENVAARIARSKNAHKHLDYRPTAEKLVNIDDDEVDDYGQDVRHAFPKADYFVDMSNPALAKEELERFVEILFEAPFVTPTRDEAGMFQAMGAACRSSDMSRQVGAAITTKDGDLVALGTNEVSAPGGGQVWAQDDFDDRDFVRGEDSSTQMRLSALREVLRKLAAEGLLNRNLIDNKQMAAGLEKKLQKTQLMQVGEYGRAVHAEMAAIVSSARRGVSVAGATLYTTTFPCHNCAKHIIAAGIARVVFVEPYPKSLAEELFGRALQLGDGRPHEGAVRFQPFAGVAPSRFVNWFSVDGKRSEGGRAIAVKLRERAPRTRWPTVPAHYFAGELEALGELRTAIEERKKATTTQTTLPSVEQ